jgi:signal transduction histidine kinase/ActR/RegA family two-component response regulator
LLALLVLAVIALPGAGQRRAADTARGERAAFTPGSEAWFLAGFDQVEAELAWDVAAAVRTADELVAAARVSAPAGALAAATALREAARATSDGPTWTERVEPVVELPLAGVSAAIRAHYHAARAERAWLEDQPIDVLSHALAALRDARQSGDVELHVSCAWLVHGITEAEAPSYDAELWKELESASTAPEAARFEPWRRLNFYWRSYSGRSFDERLALVEAAAQAAEDAGDLRTACLAHWERGVLASEASDSEKALAEFEDARAVAERAGLRRELITSLELAAGLALDVGAFDRCAQFLEQARTAADGRGLPDKDVNLAHVRFRLASARKDEPTILAMSAELDRLRRAEADRHRGYAALREELLGSERQRFEFEQNLARARAGEAEARGEVRNYVVAVVVVFLAAMVVLAWLSRRKLATANALLQAEIRRTEAEAEARRALEQQMRQLERTQSLGLVASGVAHDFNNLMTGVLGNAELLRLSETDPTKQRQLDAIAGAGERGARLCRQLQTYSGDEPIALEPEDLGRLFVDFAPVLEAAAGRDVVLELAPDADDVIVDCNRTQLEQALLNLVTNARDARARHVKVRLARVGMRAADWSAEAARGEPRDGEFARIDVEDDGEGMSAELMERIFDPFFTTRFPGRGLGLAVAFGAVRRHHGVVSVSSRPGVGTRFRVYLPLRAGGEAEVVLEPRRPADVARIPTAPSMDVLVVDDEADVREFVRIALEARGHRVTDCGENAPTLEELAELVRGERSVALIDLTMPSIDGRAVVRALRASPTAPAIVLMSGHAAAHLAETSRELAVDGFLSKPFKAKELESTLARALESHRANARPA